MEIRHYGDSASSLSDCASFLSPQEIYEKCASKETFAVNIVTSWCPDCTQRQATHLPAFVESLNNEGISVYQCLVQEERGVFLSSDLEEYTSTCGGHGYPRTVLYVDGVMVDNDNVEVVSEAGLKDLATRFIDTVS